MLINIIPTSYVKLTKSGWKNDPTGLLRFIQNRIAENSRQIEENSKEIERLKEEIVAEQGVQMHVKD